MTSPVTDEKYVEILNKDRGGGGREWAFGTDAFGQLFMFVFGTTGFMQTNSLTSLAPYLNE